MSIRHRLFFAVGSLAVILAAIGLIAWHAIRSIEHDVARVSENSAEEVVLATRITEQVMSLALAAHRVVESKLMELSGEPDADASAAESCTDDLFAPLDMVESALDSLRDVNASGVLAARRAGEQAEQAGELSEAKLIDRIARDVAVLRHLLRAFVQLAQHYPARAADFFQNSLQPHLQDELVQAVRVYQIDAEAELKQGAAEARQKAIDAQFLVVLVALATILLACFSALWGVHSILGPLDILHQGVARIRRGDFTVNVDVRTRDELGSLAGAFNKMVQELRLNTVTRAYMEDIINAMPHCLLVISPDGQVLSLNRATSELLGYPPDELLGRSWKILLAQPEATTLGYLADWETELQTKSSERILVSLSTAAIRSGAGDVTHWIFAAQDLRERHKAGLALQELQGRLFDASRQAGMAEVATGILHNVGNVLNSVNVSTKLLQEWSAKSRVSSLLKAAELMAEHLQNPAAFFTEHPKGKLLPAFLVKLAPQLILENQQVRQELTCLAQNIEHINGIVAMQQSYARTGGLHEHLSAVELVEEALRSSQTSFTRHGITVVRRFSAPTSARVAVDRHKLRHILLNLFRNAEYALQQAPNPTLRELVVSISHDPDGHVRTHIADTGMGIPPENLIRIFQHGFTTRPDGHGFGLHASANAAREMGGQLTARSDGPGRGAVFTLELPLAQEPNDRQAA